MMDNRLTKWDEANECWLENHDNDTREWKNGSRACMDKLAAYEDAAPLEKVREWAGAFAEGRLEIITQRQKEARDNLRDYSAEDRFFDDEYD